MSRNEKEIPELGFSGQAGTPEFKRWSEEIGRALFRFETVPLNDGQVFISPVFQVLPGIVVGRGTGSPNIFSRPKHLIDPGEDDLRLTVTLDVPIGFTSRGEDQEIRASETSLSELRLPSSTRQQHAGEFMTLKLSRQRLKAMCPDIEDKFQRAIPGSNPAAALLKQYLKIITEPGWQSDMNTKSMVAQHILDLVALAASTSVDHAEEAKARGGRAAQLQILKAEITARATEPDLSIAAMARQFNVSERYLQQLLEESGTAFTKFLLEQRVRFAYRLLISPQHRRRKISDIAFSSGFGALPYFHRAFRHRFGGTPAEIRAMATDDEQD